MLTLTFQNLAVSYVSPDVTFKNSTWCSLCIECFFYGFQNKQH